ncbi:MAG: VOC family protein [Cyclobacteriaceae bacterium]
MKPSITVLTLGVNDLERAVRFYRDGLGFPTKGIEGQEYDHGSVKKDYQYGFEKLEVWQSARELVKEIYLISNQFHPKKNLDLQVSLEKQPYP